MIYAANLSVARTSASTFSGSNAVWPEAGEMIRGRRAGPGPPCWTLRSIIHGCDFFTTCTVQSEIPQWRAKARPTTSDCELRRELVRRPHQRVDVLRLERGVAGGGGNDQFALRPRLVQVPGVLDRADHVIAAVDDHAGDVGDAVGVAQQLVFDFEEAAVDEVVVLDARERERERGVFVPGDEILVHVQEAGGAFPHAPGARGGEPGGFVVAGEAAVEGRDQIMPFDRRNRGEIVFPRIREQPRGAFLIEPFQFP